jgi:hypothetical protein
MSFLKQILSPFIEFDDQKKAAEEEDQQPAPATRANVRAPKVATTSPDENATHPLINSPGVIKERVDQTPGFSPGGVLEKPLPEHVAYFEKLIDEANASNPLFKGVDYKEYVDSKGDIDDIQDEALKYQTAFNILKGSGLNKAKLLETGQEYLNVIGRDLNNFQHAHSVQYRKEVEPKEKEIRKKAEELQNLQQRVNELKSNINTLTQEINITKDKLNTVKNSFLLAGEQKQNEIESELKRIDKYF